MSRKEQHNAKGVTDGFAAEVILKVSERWKNKHSDFCFSLRVCVIVSRQWIYRTRQGIFVYHFTCVNKICIVCIVYAMLMWV